MSDHSLPTTVASTTMTTADTSPPTLMIVDKPPATTTTSFNPSTDFLLITDTPLESYNPQHLVASPASGATAVFVGTTRDNFNGRRVVQLSYECYTAMATQQLQTLATEMHTLWQLERVAILHRTGCVEIGEASVLIAASSAHRREALDAVSWCIDELKRRVVVWKKEVYADGSVWKENSEYDMPALIKQTTDVLSPSHVETGH